MFLGVYQSVRCLKNICIDCGGVNDIPAVIKGQGALPIHIRPWDVFCVFIADPKKTVDFLKHQVDNFLLF